MKFKKTIIIAEAGVNHNGNIKIACKLARLAKKVKLIMLNSKLLIQITYVQNL